MRAMSGLARDLGVVSWAVLVLGLGACRAEPPNAAGYLGASASDDTGGSGSTGGPGGPTDAGDTSNVSEIDNGFVQTQWDQAGLGTRGDISFGAAEQPGPVTSFSGEGVVTNCESCQIPYPASGVIHTLGMVSEAFRIGWGEAGGQHEGWYPWWSGTIRVR